ncbi:MAG: DUF1467 family protein [Pseudomonadota bacterium]
MTITSAIVLFAVIWAVVFFLVLPWGQVSQYEAGDVVPGTPASAPSDAMIRKKLIVTTLISIVAYAIVFCIIYFRVLTIDDLTFMTPPSQR